MLSLSGGFYSLSPVKMQFDLFLNASYANIAADPARLSAFTADLRDATALAFQVCGRGGDRERVATVGRFRQGGPRGGGLRQGGAFTANLRDAMALEWPSR